MKLDGTIDQIFDLQDQLVQELARTGMAHELASSERDAIVATTDASVEAFEAYSRGMLNLRMASRDGGPCHRAVRAGAGTAARYIDAMIALGSALDLKGTFLAMPAWSSAASSLLQQAVALKPESAEAHLRLGETLSDLGRIDEGIAEMQEACALLRTTLKHHANLARDYWMGKGDVDLGASTYRRALALNPEGGYTHLQLALLHALRGELDDAEREARAAVVLQEQAMSGTQGLLVVGAHSRLGYVFYRRGDYDEAIREYRRELEFVSLSDHALARADDDRDLQKLSAAYQRKGDGENAQAYFDRAVRAFDQRLAGGGDDPYTRYYMAALHAMRGDIEAARRHLERPLAKSASSLAGACSATRISTESGISSRRSCSLEVLESWGCSLPA